MRKIYVALAALLLLVQSAPAVASSYQERYDYCEQAHRDSRDQCHGNEACLKPFDDWCRKYANVQLAAERSSATAQTCDGSNCTPRQWCRFTQREISDWMGCKWGDPDNAPGCPALDKYCASRGY